jgi:serine/threonine protein kinase
MADEHIRQVGRYRIVREIGRGGMAAVYLARQIDLDRDVALKELNSFHAADPAFAERFVRESRVAGSMQHPNIVTVFEFLSDGGIPYIAMEYVERGSLRPFVGHTTMAQTIGVLEGALAGLAQAERRGIVHRDIKPENLMVTADGEVKIADFGIAKALSEAGGPNLTATGTTVGTPAYMAPEQATAGDIGPWTDLYSVGITAYEMTVSRVPFHDSTTPVAVLMRQVSEDIPSAASVDPSVDRRFSDWIDRLLMKDPKARTQGARQAWYELEEIAVAALGPLWRREARLLVSGTDRAAGPLTPAPFERATPPPQDAGGGYETYLGESPAGAAPPPPPPPPPPPSPSETLEGQPLAPAAAAGGQQATIAPASAAGGAAPPAGNETFQWPAAHAGRNRLLIPAAIIVLAAIAVGAYLFTSRGGSSTTAGKAKTTSTKGHTTPPPAALPTVTAVPSGFVAGELQSVSPSGGHAWALSYGKPERILDLQGQTASSVQVPPRTVNLAAGDGSLWVSGNTASGGQIARVTPGGSPAVGTEIAFPAHVASARAVIASGTIWQPVVGGLYKVAEAGGTPVKVKGIDFTPYSVELIGSSIWATDGKGKLAQVPVSAAAPQATVTPLPGAGWLTGDAKAVYVVGTAGVTRVDPANPSSQTPVAGISAPPIRIADVGGILWTATYSKPSGKTVTGTLEGFDLDHAGKHTTPVRFTAPKGGYITKLVDVGNTFWLTVAGPGGKSGLQPFTISQ